MNRALLTVALAASAILGATNRASAENTPAKSAWNLKGDGPHLIAHYMPWFRNAAHDWQHWKFDAHDPQKSDAQGHRDIAAKNYPLIGPYDSLDPKVIAWQIRTAKAAGIEAFAAIWYGPHSETDDAIPLLLAEAQRQDFKIALCYEEKTNFPPYRDPSSRTQMRQTASDDLTYALEKYGSNPAYLRRNGLPFIFQFNGYGSTELGPRYFTATEWRWILTPLQKRLVYARQNFDLAYYPSVQGAYRWWSSDFAGNKNYAEKAGQAVQDGKLGFWMSAIAPGFDDSGVNGWGGGPRVFPRNGEDTLQKTMETALIGNPELVQIVTWNDWNEGTQIEPSVEYGYSALDAIETWWAKVKGRTANLADNKIPFPK